MIYSNRKQAPLYLIIFISFFSYSIVAQPGTKHATSILDGNAVPKQHVRHDDVLWMKTVWQRIDLRERMNHPLYFTTSPTQHRASLFDVLLDLTLEEGVINTYDPGILGDDDMMITTLSGADLKERLISRDTVQRESLFEDGQFESVELVNKVGSEDVAAYDIKETWFIDRNRSVMEVRIVGICPVMAVYDDETGEFRGTKRLFWIYYPELRDQLVRNAYYNPNNDLQSISLVRMFDERRFSSHITKVSNVYDRTIGAYQSPMDALLTGAEEEEKIRNLELDMWNY